MPDPKAAQEALLGVEAHLVADPDEALRCAQQALQASALAVGSAAQLASHYALAVALAAVGNEEGAAVARRAAEGLGSAHPQGAVWAAWHDQQRARVVEPGGRLRRS